MIQRTPTAHQAITTLALALAGCVVEEAPVPSAGDGVSVTKGEGDTIVGVDPRVVPVVPNCLPGRFVQRTETGWTCETDLFTWQNLDGIPAEIADGDDLGITVETDPTVNALARAPLECWEGDIAKRSGTTWRCAPDDGIEVEADPRLAATATGSVPRFDGSRLVDGAITDDGARVSIRGELAPASIALVERPLDLFDAIDVEMTTTATRASTLAAFNYLGPAESRMILLRVGIRARTSRADTPAIFEVRSLAFGTGPSTGLAAHDADAPLLGILSVTGDAYYSLEITLGPLAARTNEGTRFIVRWRAGAGASAFVDDLVFELRDTTIRF